jgi:hypothetical protein
MSSDTSSPPDPEFLAAAAQSRNATTTQALSSSELLRQHEQRQKFRRLIDPGISRPNSQEAAMASLKVCSGCVKSSHMSNLSMIGLSQDIIKDL